MVKLSKLGTSGSHAGNCHRDLLALAGDHCLTKAVSSVPIRLKFKKFLSELVTLDLLLPYKLFSLIFHSLPEAFTACILGGDEANIQKFWRAMKDNPKLLSRPELRGRQDLHHVVPISIHHSWRWCELHAGGKSRWESS